MHKQKSSIMPRLKLGRQVACPSFNVLVRKFFSVFTASTRGRPARTKLSISRPFISCRAQRFETLDGQRAPAKNDCSKCCLERLPPVWRLESACLRLKGRFSSPLNSLRKSSPGSLAAPLEVLSLHCLCRWLPRPQMITKCSKVNLFFQSTKFNKISRFFSELSRQFE